MDTITPPTTKGRTLSSTSTDLAAPNPPRRPPDLLETGRDPEPGATRLRRVEAPPLLRAAPWSPSRRLARGFGAFGSTWAGGRTQEESREPDGVPGLGGLEGGDEMQDEYRPSEFKYQQSRGQGAIHGG